MTTWLSLTITEAQYLVGRARELKNSEEFGSIPIVLVSSKDGESDKFWGLQQGADGYVIKPFTGAQLVGEVQRVIG